jgi:hypothetical protein
MHWNFCTLGSLKRAVDSLIDRYGDNTPIGVESTKDKAIGDISILHVVYVDGEGNITGTYDDDDSPKTGEITAIGII